MGTRGGRKIQYAPVLVDALDLARVPRPLDGVLAHVYVLLGTFDGPPCRSRTIASPGSNGGLGGAVATEFDATRA